MPKTKKKSIPTAAKLLLLLVLLLAVFLGVNSLYSTEESKYITGRVVQEAPAKPAEQMQITALKIIDPISSTQQIPFTVSFEVPSGQHTCYFGVSDSGVVTYDRRTRVCANSIEVNQDNCKSTGRDACKVFYFVNTNDGKLVGSVEKYFTIN